MREEVFTQMRRGCQACAQFFCSLLPEKRNPTGWFAGLFVQGHGSGTPDRCLVEAPLRPCTRGGATCARKLRHAARRGPVSRGGGLDEPTALTLQSHSRLAFRNFSGTGPVCRDGGIGRRSGLKIRRWQHLASSSLAPGTKLNQRVRCNSLTLFV